VNHRTAFHPQRQVDARTGRIQGNKSTKESSPVGTSRF
jgi:hypothetical protein